LAIEIRNGQKIFPMHPAKRIRDLPTNNMLLATCSKEFCVARENHHVVDNTVNRLAQIAVSVANSSPSPLRDARVAGSRAPIASLVVPYFSTGKSKPFANLVQSGLGSQSDGIEQELYQVRAVACSAVETRQFSACGATG